MRYVFSPLDDAQLHDKMCEFFSFKAFTYILNNLYVSF